MRYIVVHHSACGGEALDCTALADAMHFVVDRDGKVTAHLPLNQTGQHPLCIGVVVEGDFALRAPTAMQLDSLRSLLLDLVLKFPGVEIGGHRQLRGAKTKCPGSKFPLKDLRQWAVTDLVRLRDERLQAIIDRQYFNDS